MSRMHALAFPRRCFHEDTARTWDQREDKEHPLRRGIVRGISKKRLPMSARFDVGVCTRFDMQSTRGAHMLGRDAR